MTLLFVSFVYVATFAAILYFGREYFATKLKNEYHNRVEGIIEERYQKRIDGIHASHKVKNRALMNESKGLMMVTGELQQNVEVTLLEVRQALERQTQLNNQAADIVQDLEITRRLLGSTEAVQMIRAQHGG